MLWTLVIGSHRSGTNMLLHALNKLPKVCNLSELIQVTFNRKQDQDETNCWRLPLLEQIFNSSDFPDYIKPQWLPWADLPSEDNVKTFLTSLFKDYSLHWADILCGKILFQQCPPQYHTLWQWLYSQPIKIIYLRRKNPLHIIISNENAVRNAEWFIHKHHKKEPSISKFELTIQRVLRDLTFLSMCESYFTILTYKTPKAILVDYDNLVNNWEYESKRILQHMGLDPSINSITPQSKKQITVNYSSLVTNYDELKTYFRGTQYEHHFL